MTVVPVLGMHRSGTSMLTRVLNLLGMQLGEPLLPPGGDNPLGYWENMLFLRANMKLLLAMGRNDNGFGPYDEMVHTPALARRLKLPRDRKERIRGQVAAQFTQPVWGWKDPRNVLTYPLWKRLLQRFGYEDIRPVLITRSREDVLASIYGRGSQSQTQHAATTYTAYTAILDDMTEREYCHHVSYERLCDPKHREEMLWELAGYAGLEPVDVRPAWDSIQPRVAA